MYSEWVWLQFCILTYLHCLQTLWNFIVIWFLWISHRLVARIKLHLFIIHISQNAVWFKTAFWLIFVMCLPLLNTKVQNLLNKAKIVAEQGGGPPPSGSQEGWQNGGDKGASRISLLLGVAKLQSFPCADAPYYATEIQLHQNSLAWVYYTKTKLNQKVQFWSHLAFKASKIQDGSYCSCSPFSLSENTVCIAMVNESHICSINY